MTALEMLEAVRAKWRELYLELDRKIKRAQEVGATSQSLCASRHALEMCVDSLQPVIDKLREEQAAIAPTEEYLREQKP